MYNPKKWFYIISEAEIDTQAERKIGNKLDGRVYETLNKGIHYVQPTRIFNKSEHLYTQECIH